MATLTSQVPTKDRPRFRRWAAITGLMVLSPISAEYLIGYDDITGRPLDLLAGLLILAPLYGTVAVLIREIVRRTGRGWPTILLLGAAFGVIQAGLIDQGLFFREFSPDDPAWATEAPKTPVPGMGVDVANFLTYVGGHAIWSFAAPIAMAEACAPRLARRCWLGPVGMVVMAVLWVLAAVVIFNDVAAGSTATAGQLIGAAVFALALIGAAFAIRPLTRPLPGQAPSWWFVGIVTGAVLSANQLLPGTWAWTAVNIAALIVLGWLLLRWSRREGWEVRHVLAVASAALLVRGLLSFLVEPLGQVDYLAKYAANAVIFGSVVALIMVASRRLSQKNGC